MRTPGTDEIDFVSAGVIRDAVHDRGRAAARHRAVGARRTLLFLPVQWRAHFHNC
jgi:hypothetical protein